ncbi:FtsX-like permease family protein [Roseimaritima multifibrata]|uniref:FtsX-like permease family protein n=1 Tax=Roseimaritima multifibrata TaxID=1930274 RepID=A0A517MIS4_9BACT|nr:FtsX-like permease family protein [Roseimaritima multifibrata]QDS94760.1 FtsX-like permease family protein [Roseimaritima multifibrata]
MTSLKLLTRLVTSQMRLHPGRVLITALGIIASTCAVVWVVSGYDALVSQFDENAGKYLGRYDALVIAKSPPGQSATIPSATIQSIHDDAGVIELNPISQSRASVTRVEIEGEESEEESSLGLLVGSRPPVNGAPPVDPTLVSTPAAEQPYELVRGTWLPANGEVPAAVLSANAAQMMNISVGDNILVTTMANQLRLKVVGIVEQAPQTPTLGERRPGGGKGKASGRTSGTPHGPRNDSDGEQRRGGKQPMVSSASQSPVDTKQPISLPSTFGTGIAIDAVYVRPAIAAIINGYPADPQVLQIAMREGVSIDQFRDVWADKFAQHRPALELIDFAAVRKGMESGRSISGQQSQAWAATGMASLAAIFIIFSTLSMGVSERSREFAMLRAVALTRSQIATIIAMESVLLALVGWIGGLVAGWIMVLVGSQVLPGLFNDGAVLGWTTVLLTGVTVFVGALGAAILPAWRAMRIQPLDAMSKRTVAPQLQRWKIAGGVGLIFAFAAPLTVFFLPMSDDSRKWCYSFLTYPMLLIGMILIAPSVIMFCERVLGPIVTRLMGIDSRMMQTQLSNNMWRTIGATLALSVGLGLYASTQTWGYSMLQPFTPGDWLPDALVAFHPIGLEKESQDLVGQVDQVDAEQVMPLAIEQAKFDWGDAGTPDRLKFGDNGIVCGLSPKVAFGGEQPMLPVTFVEGDATSAITALESGAGCVVSEDFSMATGRGVGDTITFTPPSNDEERVSYKIQGIVSLPGWQWVTKFSGVRRHFVRTGAIVFANRARVQQDFHLGNTEFFWLNFKPNVDLVAAEKEFQSIAELQAGETFTASGIGEVKAYRPFARMTATETVRRAIRKRADGMIWGMSYLPLVTLIIMSLAVANTVIASVRSRTWEFGVMRSIGVTRGQLIRLVLAETILIAASACLLSLIFGLIAGWCGVGMAQFGGWFAGPPSFMIPWTQLAFGFSLTIALCLLAGMWPALKTGRSEPLGLLQAGRGTM